MKVIGKNENLRCVHVALCQMDIVAAPSTVEETASENPNLQVKIRTFYSNFPKFVLLLEWPLLVLSKNHMTSEFEYSNELNTGHLNLEYWIHLNIEHLIPVIRCHSNENYYKQGWLNW